MHTDEELDHRLEKEAELLRQYEPVRSVSVVPAQKTIRVLLAVPFAASFALEPVSPTGVRREEAVDLVFTGDYPFKAPEIRLRPDFPKSFPHINPKKEFVVPCVFDGALDDFIQQPNGLSGLVYQLVDWLAKAATGELIDFNQGWEPMRNDESVPTIVLPVEEILFQANQLPQTRLRVVSGHALFHKPYFTENDPCIFVLGSKNNDENAIAGIVVIPPEHLVVCQYLPNDICNYSLFSQYIRQQMPSVADEVLAVVNKHYGLTRDSKSRYFLAVLGIHRPARVIGTNSDVEFLPILFARKNNNKANSLILHKKALARLLRPVFNSTPALLQRLSGTKRSYHGRIRQLGCGSLGSKIALHLMRNGNEHFDFVDNKNFLPFHNARHALSAWVPCAKAALMHQEAAKMGLIDCYPGISVLESLQQSKPEDILVDSTASLAVRNLLASECFKGRLVHTALYENGTRGILLSEGTNRNPRIDDLFLSLFWKSVESDDFPIRFTNIDATNIAVGQGCGNLTTIMPDSRISLFAAGMAGKIQRMLDGVFPEDGLAEIGASDDGESISWKTVETGKSVCLPVRKDGYQVRILSGAADAMRCRAAAAVPNETGGSLLGHINPNTMTITILSFFPPPEDAVSTPSRFELKDKEHQSRLSELEERSGGLITYLGTWHSHPCGGGPSATDRNTYVLHDDFRRPVPTVCLIVADDLITEYTSK